MLRTFLYILVFIIFIFHSAKSTAPGLIVSHENNGFEAHGHYYKMSPTKTERVAANGICIEEYGELSMIAKLDSEEELLSVMHGVNALQWDCTHGCWIGGSTNQRLNGAFIWKKYIYKFTGDHAVMLVNSSVAGTNDLYDTGLDMWSQEKTQIRRSICKVPQEKKVTSNQWTSSLLTDDQLDTCINFTLPEKHPSAFLHFEQFTLSRSFASLTTAEIQFYTNGSITCQHLLQALHFKSIRFVFHFSIILLCVFFSFLFFFLIGSN